MQTSSLTFHFMEKLSVFLESFQGGQENVEVTKQNHMISIRIIYKLQ